jgi:WD40 repeat protein
MDTYTLRWSFFITAWLVVGLMDRQTTTAQENLHIKDLRSAKLMTFAPDSRTFAFVHYPSGRQAITVWDFEKQQATLTLNDTLSFSLSTMKFAQDGKHIVVPSREENDWALSFLDCRSGEIGKKVMCKSGSALLGLSEGARCLITRGTGEAVSQVTVTHLASGKSVWLQGQQKQAREAFFSPDSSIVVTRDTHLNEPQPIKVKIWESASGKLRHTISHEDWDKYRNPHVSISSDNKILAIQGMRLGGLQFFDLGTGEEVGKKIPPFNKKIIYPVYGPIVFLLDNKHVAARSSEKKQDLDIWNVAAQKKVMTLVGTEEEMGDLSLALSPDGRYIARCNSGVAGRGGSISIWEVPKFTEK